MSVLSENASVDSEMDVDGLLSVQNEQRNRTGLVFAQSEELNVTLLAHLPIEVLRVLKNAGEFLSSVGLTCLAQSLLRLRE